MKQNEQVRNKHKQAKCKTMSFALHGSLTPRAPSPLTGPLTLQAPSLLVARTLRAPSLLLDQGALPPGLAPLLGHSPSGLPPCWWLPLPLGSLPTQGYLTPKGVHSLTPFPPSIQAKVGPRGKHKNSTLRQHTRVGRDGKGMGSVQSRAYVLRKKRCARKRGLREETRNASAHRELAAPRRRRHRNT